MEKTYKQTAIQICGDCLGQGVLYVEPHIYSHGSDNSTGKLVTCKMCEGNGRVKVVKDITITITPHTQYQRTSEPGFTGLKN